MMATTNTTEPVHPAYTGGRREYLAAWSTRRLTAALPFAILTLLGINPVDPAASGAITVFAVLFVVGGVVQHQLHRRSWWWVPSHAPACPEPAGFFWARATLDVALPVASAWLVLTFTQSPNLPSLVALFFAIGAGYAAAAPFRAMSPRDRIAQTLQCVALGFSTGLLGLPDVVSIALVGLAAAAFRLGIGKVLRDPYRPTA